MPFGYCTLRTSYLIRFGLRRHGALNGDLNGKPTSASI
jgi:hypothetical protein